MPIKAVFFDLFETLISEYSNGNRLTVRPFNYMGITNDEFKKEWSYRQLKRMTGVFPDYPSVIKDIMESRSLPYNDEAVQYLYQERIKEKIEPFLHIHSDIFELLQYLRNHHIKLGLISNCTEEEVQYWYESSLAPYFDTVIFSYEVGTAKPDIAIYQLGCELLSVSPEESLFVGDGGSGELDGAYHAGLRAYHAVWFNTYVQSNYKKIELPRELIDEIEILLKYEVEPLSERGT